MELIVLIYGHIMVMDFFFFKYMNYFYFDITERKKGKKVFWYFSSLENKLFSIPRQLSISIPHSVPLSEKSFE